MNAPSPACRVCGSATAVQGRARVLGRHDVGYWRCTSCGYIQTDTPTWLDEAYRSAIAASDVGLVSRNLEHAAITRSLIHACFDRHGRFVDFGGGYGLLVRLLRDKGLDARRHEPRCDNLFAQGLDVPPPETPSYELLTAFEVFEHLVDPAAELASMLKFSRSIFFSTLLVPEPAPAPGTWWYYAHETGQHVGFFTVRSLDVLAERSGLRLLTDGRRLHLLTDKDIPSWLFRTVTRCRIARVLNAAQRGRALTDDDYRSAGNA